MYVYCINLNLLLVKQNCTTERDGDIYPFLCWPYVNLTKEMKLLKSRFCDKEKTGAFSKPEDKDSRPTYFSKEWKTLPSLRKAIGGST